MHDMKPLETDFHNDMLWILEHEAEVGLHSTRFRQMIERYGGLKTAHLLLEADRELPPDTFGYLRRVNRRDLAMESYVVKEKYLSLFSEQERQIAKWRLDNED